MQIIIKYKQEKYKQIKNRQERSKVANIFSYLPVLVVIVGQLILLVHTLTFKLYPNIPIILFKSLINTPTWRSSALLITST